MKKSGIELIAEERARQVLKEGFTKEHDIEHDCLQLSAAAASYITSAHNKWIYKNTHTDQKINTRFQVKYESMAGTKWVDGFPFRDEFDKREKHDVLKSLIIAGALLAAEIDRLQYYKT